jgi:transposase
MIDELEKELSRIEDVMGKEVKGNKEMERLETIPGVGFLTAFAFLSYVKVSRFSNSSQVANYLGLVPQVAISGDTVRNGRITKRGNGYVRALLNQAAWALVRSKKGGALKGWYNYMTETRGKGKKKSIVGVSRKLSELLYTLLRNGRDFEARRFETPESQATKKLALEALAA